VKLAEAKSWAQKAVKKMPKIAVLQNMLAGILARTGDQEGAYKAWDEVFKLAPNNANFRKQAKKHGYPR